MSDGCKYCDIRGKNFKVCPTLSCGIPESWHAEQLKAEIEKRDNLVVDQGMQIEETYKVLSGEKVSDFALTFELVSKAEDRMAKIERLTSFVSDLKEQIANFNPCGHTEFESVSCGVCGYPDSRKLIADLKEKLRLSDLRGDSLDRVVDEGVQKELTLEKEIAGLKAELNTERLFHKSFVETTQAADKDYEESILKLKADRDNWVTYAKEKDQELERLKAEAQELHDKYGKLWDKLSHLTALVDDDKRADRVASKANYMNWPVLGWRKQAITDYRTDIKEEIESPHG